MSSKTKAILSKISEMSPIKKRKFRVDVKSHTDAPDYEDAVEAYTKRGATKKFAKRLSKYETWTPKMIKKYVSRD